MSMRTPPSQPFDCHAQYLKDVLKCGTGPGRHHVLVLVKIAIKDPVQRWNTCFRLGFMARIVEDAHNRFRGKQCAYMVGPHTPRAWRATKTFGFNTKAQAAGFVKLVTRTNKKNSVTAALITPSK